MRTDGKTDRQKYMTKLIVTFYNVANAHKNENQLFTLLRI